MIDESPRYAHARDYLRVLRENWLIIVFLMLLAAGGALFISQRQRDVYEAKASISFADVTQDLELVGTAVAPGSAPPSQLPPARAKGIDAPAVTSAVQRVLRARGSTDALSSVSTSVDAKSNLVDVTAQASTAAFAASLANLYAKQAAMITNRQARQRFEQGELVLIRHLRHAARGRDSIAFRAALIDQIGRLAFLRRTSTPAEVVSLARTPSTPVSPTPVLNALLAALAGLVIGLVVAFLRDSFDRRLRGSRQIQRYLDYPVVGRIRVAAMGKALGGGDTRNDKSAADIEAFRIARENLGYLGQDHSVRSVLVTSAVPEEGKSTVAASLAFAIASTGARTLLVECDLRRPVLAKRLGLSPTPGFGECLAGTARPRDVLQRVSLPRSVNGVTHRDGSADAVDEEDERRALSCITSGGAAATPAELFDSERCRRFLQEVTDLYDTVILDTSPLLVVADTLALLPHVDGVLLCVRSAQTTRDQALAAKEALEHFPQRPTGIMVTGLRARDEGDSYSYAYAR